MFLFKRHAYKKDEKVFTLEETQPRKNTGEVEINNSKLFVEIMRSDSEKTLGLSGRKKLMPNSGMLFDFSSETNSLPSFWMKDMSFAIDIIWIKNNEVLYIHKNVLPPTDKLSKLEIYTPPSGIDYVLEVDSGWSERNYVKTGDRVKLKF